MVLYLRLAWRNLWRHKRRTIIVVASIGLTLAMMMFYDGLVAGFQEAIYGNAIRVLGGNIQIHAAGYAAETGTTPLLALDNAPALVTAAESDPRVLTATRRIVTGGLISNHTGALGISIIGVEPEKEAELSLIAQNVKEGSYLTSGDKDVILIGRGLADAMELKLGDRIAVAGRGMHEKMSKRTMTVGGIYDLGMADIEKQTVFVSLGEAQELYGLEGQATEVMLLLEKIGQEPAVIAALKTNGAAASEFSSWQTNFPELETALTTKSGVMNVFGVIILVISGIGILNLLLMAVYERTREIGVLGALGMKPPQISTLFLLEGALMGLLGLGAGVAIGLGLNFWLGQVGLDYSGFTSMGTYFALLSERVYPSLGMEKLLQRGLTVIIIAVLSALIPAREAAMHEPAQALHFV